MVIMSTKKRKINEVSDGTEDKVSQNDNDAEAEKPTKSKVKKKTLDFDVKHFRKELNMRSGQTVCMTQFIQACSKSDETDYVSLYLKSGGNASEILTQLDEKNKKNPSVAAPVFSILNLILSSDFGSSPQMLQASEETCRYFLNSYVSTVEFMLGEKSTSKHQIVALKLLTAIVKLNSELGFTVLNQLTLQSKSLHHLAKGQSEKEKDNVRLAFIQFLLAFLAEGNATLIKALLEKQGLLALIMPDLVKDNSEMILLVLNMLKKNVISTLNISKTIKIRTFSHNVLLNIFNLFNWKGAKLEKSDLDEKKLVIDDVVYDFLLTLCTSHKHGIYFADKTLGMGDVVTNQYLWKSIESLDSPWNNERAGKLIVNILTNCPDLYKPVMHLVEQVFEARNSEKWLKTITFLKNLMLALSNTKIVDVMVNMTAAQISNFIKVVFLPIQILKLCTSALKSSDNAIKNEVTLLLQRMLRSIKAYLAFLKSDARFQSGVYMVVKNRTESFTVKHLPSTEVLTSVMHSLLDKFESTEDAPSEGFKLDLPGQSAVLINILNVLLLHNDIVPNSLDPISTTLDSKRLFDKIRAADDLNNDELKLKVTKFLLCADKFAFSPGKPLFKEIITSMFDVSSNEDQAISNEAKTVLHSILDTTQYFKKNKAEIGLILYAVDYVCTKRGKHILDLIVEIIENVSLHEEEYEQILVDSVEDKTEDVKRNFDVIFENLENKLEDGKKVNPFEQKVHLSYFLIGVLKLSDEKIDDDILEEFMNIYIINLLHYQENPQHLMKVLENYKINKNVKKYLSSWQKKATPVSDKIFNDESKFYKLSKALISNEPIEINTVFNVQGSGPTDKESESLMSVLKIENLNDAFEAYSLFHLILFNVSQQSVLECLDELRLSNATQAMRVILEAILQSESNVVEDLSEKLSKCLLNPLFLESFSPLKTNVNSMQSLITDFILNILEFCNCKKVDKSVMDPLLRPYKHKLFLSVMSQIKKSKTSNKGPVFNKLDAALCQIGLNNSDIILITSQILKLDIKCMVSDANEASSWVHLLSYIINQSTIGSCILTIQNVVSISTLYAKVITSLELVINVSELEESLHNFLFANPEFIDKIPVSVFDALFSMKHVGKYTSKLGALLLGTNVNLLSKFNKNISNEGVIDKRELILPFASAAFQHAKFEKMTDFIQSIYNHYKANIMKIIEKPHKASQIYVDNSDLILKLIYKCMDVSDCKNFLKKIHKFDSLEAFHVDILEALFFKTALSENDSFDSTFLENYLLNLMQLAMIELKKGIIQNEKLIKVGQAFEKLLIWNNRNTSCDFKKVRESQIWQNYFKSILKLYLTTEQKETPELNDEKTDNYLFSLTPYLLYIIMPDDHEEIVTFFEMTVSHSEFLNIMLSSRFTNTKTTLLRLLHTMAYKNKNVMKAAHIPVFLSSYHATTNETDKIILSLLKLYENNGQSMTEYQPYLWGDMAANHFAVRSKRTRSSLWSNPTVNHLLNLLDRDMIERTIQNYPMHFSLPSQDNLINEVKDLTGLVQSTVFDSVDEAVKESSKNLPKILKNEDLILKVASRTNAYRKRIVMKKMTGDQLISELRDANVYDPSFLLPLLNFMVSPGSVVSCHRMVRCGVLAIPLVALSSSCPLMRAAAYNVLHRFNSHLEAEMFYKNDKLLWSQFFQTLKSSLASAIPASEDDQKLFSAANPRLPFIAALYLARAAIIMTHPLDPMFKPINNFIISKQYIDFSVVPDFLDLFHNTDILFMERRVWLLELIRDGIKTFDDVKTLLKSVTFKMMLDFYSSSLSDMKVKILILEVVNSAVCVPKAAKILSEGYGLFPWLSCVIRDLQSDNKTLLSISITLISNLWYSLAFDSQSKPTEKGQNSLLETKLFKLSDTTQCEILCLLLDVSNKLSNLQDSCVVKYLNILRKLQKNCLKNITKAQMFNVITECNVFIKNKKRYKLMVSGIENSKSSYLITACNIFESTKPVVNNEEYLITKYMFEFVINWIEK